MPLPCALPAIKTPAPSCHLYSMIGPTNRETILIIEDDRSMLRGLKDNFEFAGYRVHTAIDGEAGFSEALRIRPDLIVLDLMLPKVNGYELCRSVRQEGLEMPI